MAFGKVIKLSKYRKIPVVVDAVQFDSTKVITACEFWPEIKIFSENKNNKVYGLIHTLEGDMIVSNKDYIIKGINGEFYPCKPDIFKKTYEEV